MPASIDEVALQRIIYNTQPWGTPLQQGSAGDDASSFGALAAPQEMIATAQASVPAPAPPRSSSPDTTDGSGTSFSGGAPPGNESTEELRRAELPSLRAFTFLRLSNEMMTPDYQTSWHRFMEAMQRNTSGFKTSRSWRRSLGLEL